MKFLTKTNGSAIIAMAMQKPMYVIKKPNIANIINQLLIKVKQKEPRLYNAL